MDGTGLSLPALAVPNHGGAYADPVAVVRGLGAFLVPGALGELLRLNLERHSRVGVAQPDVLLAGVERLFDGVTEVLTARLLVGR